MFNSFRKYLKQHITEKVSVRRVKMLDEGSCEYDEKTDTYKIKISKYRSDITQIEILIHEFAHVLTNCKDDHGPDWGKEYAKVYKIYELWTEESDN